MATSRSEWVMSFVVTFMSFCAILISFFTLNEMKNQRELTLEPNLFLNKVAPFEIDYKVECDSCYLVFPEKDGQRKFPLLNLVNVGAGNAVNVVAEWEVNYCLLYTSPSPRDRG